MVIVLRGQTSAPSAPLLTSVQPGNQLALVTWDPPASNGGSPISGYQIVASSNVDTVTAQAGADSRALVLSPLQNDVTYSVAVLAVNTAGAVSAPSSTAVIVPFVTETPTDSTPQAPPKPLPEPLLAAFPADDLFHPSNWMQPATPVEPKLPDPPSIPVGVAAVAGAGRITVSWNPPATIGSNPIMSYVVSSTLLPASLSYPASARQATVTGLEPGVPVTLLVQAVSAAGSSPAAEVTATPTDGTQTVTGVVEIGYDVQGRPFLLGPGHTPTPQSDPDGFEIGYDAQGRPYLLGPDDPPDPRAPVDGVEIGYDAQGRPFLLRK